MTLCYTLYDKETGHYVNTIVAPDTYNIDLNVGDNDVKVEGDFGQFTYLKGGEVKHMPERPNHKFHFDTQTEQWVDKRTQVDKDNELQLARAEATLPKLEFIMRVVKAHIISEQSGLTVLDGQIPTELGEMVDSMTGWEKFELQAKIKAATQFDRLDHFIVTIGQFLGITPEQLDQLYGIEID